MSRTNCNHVFDCFFEIRRPLNDDYYQEKPIITQKYPTFFNDEKMIQSVPQFSYPCKFESKTVIHFSFVLTSGDSKWNFGFIRHPPTPASTCLVLISSLPWHDTFYKVLNHIESMISKCDVNEYRKKASYPYT